MSIYTKNIHVYQCNKCTPVFTTIQTLISFPEMGGNRERKKTERMQGSILPHRNYLLPPAERKRESGEREEVFSVSGTADVK